MTTINFRGDIFEINEAGDVTHAIMTIEQWRKVPRDYKGKTATGEKSVMCMHPKYKGTTILPVKIVK